MVNREPFALDEWYHCYNRGIDKRTVFMDRGDYERFIQLLYLVNSRQEMHLSNLGSRSTDEILRMSRRETLIAIGAHCLMPNHFHLLVRETNEGGISEFMRKLGIAYTMYFNLKNQRSGNLFTRPFRSRHVTGDEYFQHAINYMHCNAAELYEHSWKKGVVRNARVLQKKLIEYRYSSFGAHVDPKHPHRALLDESVFEIARPVSPGKMIRDALAYYSELEFERAHVKMSS